MSLRRQGRIEEAIRVLEEHLAASDGTAPESYKSRDKILFTLGYLHLELGDTENADHHFKTCASRYPDTIYGQKSKRHMETRS